MELNPELSLPSLMKLVSFSFWSWMYLWCSVGSEKSPEWSSRVVTLLHGSVASVVGVSQCDVFNLSKCRLTMKVTPAQYALMVWSWGYFAFDLLWCLLYWPTSYVMLCHHASALIGINIYMNKDYTGCTFACTVALLELTNPLLQIRWFLRECGYNKTVIFYTVEILYLIAFLTLRGIVGTYLIFKIMNADILDLDEKVISFVFYVVSVAFIYEIIGYVLYKYRSKVEEFKGFANEMAVVLNEQQ
ncbi:TLC domain-containing protein 5-like [Epargyreus clarus]|uniref:TLC domain-containing protein 5-like n=1 Tax=Epargyreus clarus TaxID=520877 RepID=UPI003C2CCD7D